MKLSSKKKQSVKIKPTPGYRFAGLYCGLKVSKGKDLGLVVSDAPANAVACFTTNKIQAAPVVYGKKILAPRNTGKLSAILVNSGNANAVTGLAGLKAVEESAQAAAKLLKMDSRQILISSTGKIGAKLPTQKIIKALPKLVAKLQPEAVMDFSEAIMTTDRFPKIYQGVGKIAGKKFHVTGIAKGAGMIEPNMATMLAYVLTDLDLALPLMKETFPAVVDQTFNTVSVDGDMSTNDTAALLANGVSGIQLRSKQTTGFKAFQKILAEVCENLAVSMVRDGEGATKVVEILITGAKNNNSARQMAYAIGRSCLVKTSFFGKDPNWGRVMAALGRSGETFDPQKVDIFYGPHGLVRKGLPTSPAHEAKAHRLMQKDAFTIKVNLHLGKGEARVRSADLGYEYVRINSEYRT